MIELLKQIAEIATSVGLDVVIILFIAIFTEVCKIVMKTKSDKIPIIIAFSAGLVIGVIQIIFFKIELGNILRVVAGYPAFSVCTYMLIKKFFPEAKIVKRKAK